MSTPATVARVFASYEDAKRDAGRMDMEDVLLCAAAVLAEDERVAAEVRRQYHHFVVDEFQDVSPIQAALLDLWLGGRDDLCVVGDPAQTIYSFAGASAALPARLPAGSTRGRRASSWSATTAPPRRWSRPPTRCSRASEHRGRAARAQRRRRPGGPLHRAPRRGRGGGVGRRRDPQRCSTPAPRPARSRCCSGSTPSPRRSRRRSPPAASRTSCAAPSGSSSAPRSGRPSRCCGAAPGRPRTAAAAGDELVEQTKAVVAGMGWTPEAPATPRQRPRPLGVAAGAHRPGGELRRRRARRHRSATSSTTSTGAPPSSTRRSPRASRSPPCTPPRGWSGTRSSSAASSRARCRSPTRWTRPTAVEEERRLLYVGMTRARRTLVGVVGAGPQPRRPGQPPPLAVPRRPPPRDGLGPGASRQRRPQQGRPSSPCAGSAGPARLGGRAEGRPLRRAARRSYDEALFERAAHLAARRPRRPSRCRRTSSSPTSPSRRSPRSGPPSTQQLLAITGIGRTKQEKYGDAVLALVAGTLPAEPAAAQDERPGYLGRADLSRFSRRISR